MTAPCSEGQEISLGPTTRSHFANGVPGPGRILPLFCLKLSRDPERLSDYYVLII